MDSIKTLTTSLGSNQGLSCEMLLGHGSGVQINLDQSPLRWEEPYETSLDTPDRSYDS